MKNGSARDGQIAQLIHREVNLILDCAEDGRLGMIRVVAVIPSAGGAHYGLVCAPVAHDGEGPGREELERAVLRAKGYLRRELAQSLNLRRMPELTFRFAGGADLPPAGTD